MTWESVPWMVGGSALHDTGVARNLAYAALGGVEGVIDPTDLEVRELATPGSSVRVFPGTVAIKSRATGAVDEMYVATAPTIDTITIPSTGVGVSRSDLIVARVENPHDGESWPIPSDPTVGPYVFTRRIASVPNTTTTAAELGLDQSMVALARIDIPPSTSTITQAMVKDLRSLAHSRNTRRVHVGQPSGSETLAYHATNLSAWPPSVAASPVVPDWATHCRVVATIAGVKFGGASGDYTISARLQLGAGGTLVNTNLLAVTLTAGDANNDRATLLVAAEDITIPTAAKGTTWPVTIAARRTSASPAGAVVADTGTVVAYDIEFFTKPTSNA